MPKDQIIRFQKLVDGARTVLILQPERPDTDSLCTALALEQILGDLGKDVILYSQDALPTYIDYFEGADRVTDVFPDHFDVVIIVDTASPQMMKRTLEKYQGRIAARPIIVLDHHGERTAMPFAVLELIDPACGATGELVYRLAVELDWSINADAASLLVPAIMADTRGLTIPATTAETVEAVANLVRLGANLYQINYNRLMAGAIEPDLLQLKGRLLQEIEWLLDGRLALLVIDPETLKAYSKRYAPAELVLFEMLIAKGVEAAVVIRNYAPKIKISFRAHTPIADKLAARFGGGGHPQAAAATIESGDAGTMRQKVIDYVNEELERETV